MRVVCVHSLVWDKVILTIIDIYIYIYIYYYYYYYETGRFVQLSRMNNSGGIQLTVALQMPSTACDDGVHRSSRCGRSHNYNNMYSF